MIGVNQSPRTFRLLPLFVNIKKPTRGIKVKAGSFVKIDNPRNIPEIKTKRDYIYLDVREATKHPEIGLGCNTSINTIDSILNSISYFKQVVSAKASAKICC